METKTVIEKIKETLDESLPESFIVNYLRVTTNYECLVITMQDNTYDEIEIICRENDPAQLELQISTGKISNYGKIQAIRHAIEVFQFYNRANAFK